MTMLRFGAALAALTLGLAGAASAATPSAHPNQNACFRSTDWEGWHAPDDKTLYLRVNIHDIYRVDLASSSFMLKWPDTHLVNIMHGSSYICSPLDLQLTVADSGPGGGARDFLIAKTITKLTKDEIAAIPKKDLP